MADKLDGSAIVENTIPGNRIQSGTITTEQLDPTIAAIVTVPPHPKISSLTYPGDDTAANTGGGDTIVINGSGFKQNVTVYINGSAVPSVTYTNANSVSFTAPALSAATYPLYLINTDDGGTAILVPGIQYSGTPSWTSTTPLPTQDASATWSIQLIATSDSTLSYSLQAGSSLPAGITLAANGLISGTLTSPPEDETTYNFTVVAVDLEQQDASRAFNVSVTVATLDPYFTYTTLLLHGDGTNNANNHAFVDSSNNAFAITRNGNATQGTFSPFGDNWSAFFDGTGDYLNFTNQATTGDFTCECWFYRTGNASGTYQIIFGGSGTAGATNTQLNVGDDGSIGAAIGGTVILSRTGTAVVSNQWNHLAWVRSGTTVAAFVNGNRIITGTSSAALNVDRVGGQFSGYEPIGYISNARITTSAVYNVSATSVTVPSTPLTAISNTYVLTCQSNAFVDKGPNRLAITRNGNTQVTKFDPFKPYKAIPASYGVYFDGTGDYLSAPSNAAFDLGSGNFTMEAWIYPTSYGASYALIFARYTSGGASNQPFYVTLETNGTVRAGINGTYQLQTTATAPLNAWTHVAWTRSGNDFTIWLNGVSSATLNQSVTVNNPNIQVDIGAFGLLSSNYFTGHISNARIVKGTAVYTSAFTPPTSPLTAIANTSLLACQSTTLIDNSTNAFTITRNGDARPTDFNPFTTVFVSEKYNTANGGGAVYLDGTGDYLTLADNAAFTVGSDDFTVDFWIYNNTTGARRFIYGQSNSGGQNVNIPFSIYKTASNKLEFDVFASGSGTQYLTVSSADLPLNQWVHVACVRNGGTTRIYINGVQDGTNATISTITLVDSSNLLGIGCLGEYTSDLWLGYISNLRFVKGTCLYPSGTPFILPTSPVTAIANTQLLCNFTNAGIIDSVGKNVLETVGDARVNTSVKKFGTGSMYFDGSSYLSVPWDDYWNISSGDYTVECWIKTSDTIGEIVSAFNQTSPYPGWLFGIGFGNNNGKLTFYNANASNSETKVSSLTVNDDNWHHVAMTKIGTALRFFIDGLLDSTHTLSYVGTGSNQAIRIGADNNTSPSRYLIGYIDDLRITKGVARYRYSFTPPTKAFNDGNGSLANNTSDVLVGDQVNLPVFPYTTLLLHGDGTNNANNHAFVDSSNNNFAITRNGNATQGTFSPFSPTGWSGYFDGVGDYLTATSNAISGEYTFEAWVYPTTDTVGGIYSTSNSGISVYRSATGRLAVQTSGTAYIETDAGLLKSHQWSHIAVTKNAGNTYVMYINGKSYPAVSTFGTMASTYLAGSSQVGTFFNVSANFTGYISNLRVVNGSQVYTSNFTPPTAPLTAITNTELLTCQSNRFIDNSTNNFAITRNGDVSIQAFSPFPPSVEYTANTHGGSAYFDGTGDYLETTSSQIIPSGNFTIEAWAYITSSSATQTIVAQGTGIGDGARTWMGIENNSGAKWAVQVGGTQAISSVTPVLNTWHHLAMVYNGSTIKMFLNGTEIASAASTTNASNTTMRIGTNWGSYITTGYISNIRISNTNRTINTTPSSLLSADGNTVFLANFTNAGILDSTGKNVLETVGDAKVNTAIKKYGTGSMYFDGTGDYLVTPSIAVNTLAGDFTVEMWVYRSAGNNFFFTLGDSFGSTGFDLYIGNTGANLRLYSGNSVVIDNALSSINFPTSTWTHLALVRSSGSVRLYVAGMQAGSAWSSSAVFSGRIYVGAEFYNGSITGVCNGYMDDVRVTNGIARYVTNFTPPTAAFLNK